MSGVLASPLGDVAVARVAPGQWWAAGGVALALHLAGAFAFWTFAPEPESASQQEEIIGVALGPPGGRLDPDPAPPPPRDTPRPQAPPEPNVLTERAADAPPVEYTEPPPPAPEGARLSSGFGEGGDGTAPAPSPPPSAPTPTLEPGALKAYVTEAAQLIYAEIKYPRRALEERVEGKATFRITVDKRGRRLASEMVTPTGDPALDDAILRAVEAVRAYPPLPRNYPREQLRFSVTIRFQLVYQ